jgi:uncharacterized damage-inducible protein DinB
VAERFADMFIDPEEDPRADAPLEGDEREVLAGFLRWQRDTLKLKCAGLDAEELSRRSVPTSSLSLLGLVRHMAEVERSWFRIVLSGQEAPAHFVTKDDPDADFTGVAPDPDMVTAAWDAWRAEVAYAERFVNEAANLDITGREPWRGPVSLRWVLTHMVEEYARHNGHADLLREAIDGAVGQ